MRLLRLIRRIVLVTIVLAVLAVAAGAAWVLTHRDEARSWQQVLVVASEFTDLGVLQPIADIAGADTDPARSEQAGDLPATLVTPDDGVERHPAIVLFVPDGTSADEERRVREAQHAFAAAGMAAWAVREPDSSDALVDPAVLDTIAASLAAVATHERTDDRRVSVVATGPTASLVLVAAASPTLEEQADLRAILAVQPIADLRGLVSLAATGRYLDTTGRERTAEANPELRASAGRAVLRAVRSELAADNVILDGLLDAAERSDDPLRAIEVLPAAVAGPQLRPLLDVLNAETLAEFDAAWDRLPKRFRDVALERSPLAFSSRIDECVMVLEASTDPWARADARRLADALPDARHLRLDAKDPSGVLDDPAAVRDLLSISEWWMRSAGAG